MIDEKISNLIKIIDSAIFDAMDWSKEDKERDECLILARKTLKELLNLEENKL